MKPGARLLKGGRGPLVDEAALVAALQDNPLAGAALDVFDVEPLPLDNPLRQAPNLLLSPHFAGSTSEGAMRIVAQAKANLHRVVAGEPVVDVVNGISPQVARR
jgi:D-3-phosphoglycerate dehydrogenase